MISIRAAATLLYLKRNTKCVLYYARNTDFDATDGSTRFSIVLSTPSEESFDYPVQKN